MSNKCPKCKGSNLTLGATPYCKDCDETFTAILRRQFAERDETIERLREVNRQQKAALDALPRVDRRTPLSATEARLVVIGGARYIVPMEIHDEIKGLRGKIELALSLLVGNSPGIHFRMVAEARTALAAALTPDTSTATPEEKAE